MAGEAAEQRLEPRGTGGGKVRSPIKQGDGGCLHPADGIQTPPEQAKIYTHPFIYIYIA